MKILVFGGDRRQIFASRKLSELSYDVTVAAFEKYDGEMSDKVKITDFSSCRGFDAVVFGIPTYNGTYLNCPFSDKKYSIGNVIENGEKPLVFAAAANETQREKMKSALGNYIDYGSDERLKIKNAVATAEGAISVFMSESDITAAFSRCLVVGYGRCGRALAKRLSALGAYVTVAARSPVSRVDAMCEGFNVKTIDNCLTNIYDAVFNTVPSEIFDEKDALRLNDALYIEIASLPGGMSTDARAVLGENYIKAAALPGKTAPRSSGIYIAETINELIAERK